MELRALGRSDIKVSAVGLGVMTFGAQTQEDDAFRRFMEEKETKRRLRIERERNEAERTRLQALNPPLPAVKPPDAQPGDGDLVKT